MFKGNLLFIHDDFRSAGTKLPMKIAHVYNSEYFSEDTDETYKFGVGWRLNIMQTLKEVSAPVATEGEPRAKSFVYTDAAGRKRVIGTRYYKSVTTGTGDRAKTRKVYRSVYDEKDADMRSEIGDGIYTLSTENGYNVLTDDRGTVLKFSAVTGRLAVVEKPACRVGTLRMTIKYTPNLIAVSDADGRKVCLHFRCGYLTKIRFNNRVVRAYEYERFLGRDRLVGITFGALGDGDTVAFEYDAGCGCLSSVTNPAGYTINYKYPNKNIRVYYKKQ